VSSRAGTFNCSGRSMYVVIECVIEERKGLATNGSNIKKGPKRNAYRRRDRDWEPKCHLRRQKGNRISDAIGTQRNAGCLSSLLTDI
jgi:hypothetical protein